MGGGPRLYDKDGRMWPEGPAARWPHVYLTGNLPHKGEFIVTRVVMPRGTWSPELGEFYRRGELDLGSLTKLTFRRIGVPK